MRLLLLIACAALASGAIAGCGDDGDEGDQAQLTIEGTVEEGGEDADEGAPEEIPGDADPKAVQVIDQWSETLREGDIEGAAEYFELPSVAQNGTPAVQLRTREDVIAFNRALPCGAELKRAVTDGPYTVATFELTERPGPGECGPGIGQTAETAFLIRDGLIVRWLRAPADSAPPAEGPVV